MDLNTIYDILAQNKDAYSQAELDQVTDLIDHVDLERQAIVFRKPDGREFELQLVATYSPRGGK